MNDKLFLVGQNVVQVPTTKQLTNKVINRNRSYESLLS